MKKVTYITVMTCLAAGMLVACTDELVPNKSTHNSDIVGFSLNCDGDSVQSRSGELKQPFCGVLAMTNNDDNTDSLYLHTSVTDNPVVVDTDTKKKAESRGTPITEATFGTEFEVYAFTGVDNSKRTYMNNVKVTKGTGDTWLPSENFYWTEYDLDFFAYRDQDKLTGLGHNLVYSSNADDVRKEASFSYTVPKSSDNTTDATVQPDILMAFNSCGKADYDGLAPLTFTHALSAVKFQLDIPITGKIKTVTIEGVYGSGTCVHDGTKVMADYSDATPAKLDNVASHYTWATTGSKTSYTQTFNQAIDKTMVGDKKVDLQGTNNEFTFMLIPQTLGADAKVTVVMEDSENNVTHTFSGVIGNASGTAKWEAGKTYTYIISRESVVWTYVFEVTPNIDFALVDDIASKYSVVSYKQTASADRTIPLKWAVTNFKDYNMTVDENGNATQNGVASDGSATIPSWFATFVKEGTGDVAENAVTIVPQKIETDYAGDLTMQQAALKGSETVPWDLSTHRHDGGSRNRCTANCYIVHSAGTYMIPLVYGNAIYNGQDNPSAYTYQATGVETASQYVVGNVNISGATTRYNFQDHVIKSDVNTADGASDGITQPYISKADGGKYDVADAVMLWQDAYNIVKQGSVKLCKTEDGKQAFQFTLNKDFMQQGNIIFAVRDASGTILWSWHVWVYDHNFNVYYELANYEGKLGNAGTKTYTGTFKFATGNLGHCMAKTVKIPAKQTEVTFTQYNDLDNTVSATGRMTVSLAGLNFKETVGNNTYYQWGRKDPLVGVQNRVNNLKAYYTDPAILPNIDTDSRDEFDTRKYGYKVEHKRVTIAETIQNPTVFYSDGDNVKKETEGTYLQRLYHNSRIDDWVYGPGTGRTLETPIVGNSSPTHLVKYVSNGETKTREVVTAGRESGYINLWNNYDYLHTKSCYLNPSNTACDEYNEKIDNNNTKVIKTVYDPCPVGFKMPPAAAFRSISTYGGRGNWHPLYEEQDDFSVVTSNEVKSHSYTLISLETMTQTGDKSWDSQFTNGSASSNYVAYTNDDVLDPSADGWHTLSDGNKSYYPFIWEYNATLKRRVLKSNYKDYTEGNKFNGGFQSFSETGGVSTNRFYINAVGASFTTGGDNTKMSIEATGQRYYGIDAGNTAGQNTIGVTNMAPGDVYLWTGDVVTNTNTILNGNIAVSLFLQQDANYMGGFETDSHFNAAKAMARPVRPMWDEDYAESLR